MPNKSIELLSLLIGQLATLSGQERFYILRFMWTAIAAFEKLGLPAKDLEELRGIYTGMAEGVVFKEFIDQQKEADPDGQPQSS